MLLFILPIRIGIKILEKQVMRLYFAFYRVYARILKFILPSKKFLLDFNFCPDLCYHMLVKKLISNLALIVYVYFC